MKRTALTEQFLRTLSNHLSSRPECRHISYRCVIGVEDTNPKQLDILDALGKDPSRYISFYPNIEVYPNIHLKQEANKSTVLNHVLTYHFPEIVDTPDILGNLTVYPGFLVNGIYEYQLSVTGKRRKWTRIL